MSKIAKELKMQISKYIKDEILHDNQEVILTDDLNIIEQGILDSMDIFRLIRFLEEVADIVFEPSEIVHTNFQSVSVMVNFVLNKIK